MANDELEALVNERTADLRMANERLRAELDARKRKEEALRLAVRASNTGLWDWDVQTGEIYFSPEWKAQIGYEDHELPNRIGEWECRLHPDDRERVLSRVNAYLKNPWSDYEVEFRLLHKDSSYRWILARATLFTDGDGKPMRMLGSHVDITERKRAEEGLHLLQTITFSISQAEDLDSALSIVLHTVCEATGWSLGQIWTPNREGTELECSKAWHCSDQDLKGFRTLSEGLRFAPGIGLPGRVWASKRPTWVGDVTIDENFPRAESAKEVGLRAAVGIPVLAGDEVILVMEFFVRQLRREDERLVDLITAVATEVGLVIQRKRAEEALRRTEFEYRNLVETAQAIVWRGDARTFQFSFVSKEAEKLLGYPAAQWISEPTFWRDHIHPDDRDHAVSFCVRATAEQRDHEFEYRMIAEDGRVVWLRDMVRVVVEDGGVHELVGVMVDVTERKRAEELLRQSEQKFSTIFQTIPDPVSIMRIRDGLMLDLNDAFTRSTGYLKSERVGKTSEELNLYVDQEVREWHMRELLEKGEANNLEAEYRVKDGSIRFGLMSGKVIELDAEQCAVMMVKDITDLKVAQETLTQSEKKFSTIFQTIPDAVAIVRLRDGLILDVNDAWSEQTGYSKSEAVGKTSQALSAYVDDDVRKNHLAQLLEKGFVHNLEAKYRVRGDVVGYGLLSARVVELGGEQCAVAVTRSITALKDAQETLRLSELRFRAMAETTPSAIVVFNFEGTKIRYVNAAMEQISGYSEQELSKFTMWDLVHPDSLEFVTQRRLARARGEAVPPRFEMKLVTKSGEARWVHQSMGEIEFEGEPALIATAFDITERKRAEEALQRSEVQYRALVENTPDIVARFDRDARYLFVNSAVTQVSNLRLEDFLGKRLIDVGFTEDQAKIRESIIHNVFETRRPFETEFEFEGPNGVRVFEWRVYPEFDSQRNIQSVLSINRDITERKRAEEQVKESRELLRALSAHLQSVREEERTMIAREIHDELGQSLTGLKMDLASLRRSLRQGETNGLERMIEKIGSMSELVDATIHTVRKIATDLRPGVLDDLGLVAAIEWQAHDFQKRTGITCRFTPGVDDIDLDRDRSTASFRIFQETLTNVARHSGASEVEVTLSHGDDAVALEIKDNGKGISEADMSGSRSLGLLGMRERAQLLGGEINITGSPGEGTTVTVRIPLS